MGVLNLSVAQQQSVMQQRQLVHCEFCNSWVGLNRFTVHIARCMMRNMELETWWQLEAPLQDEYEIYSALSESMGKVEIGVQDLNAVAPLRSPACSESNLCSICLEPPENMRMTLCGHSYCSECIATWLGKNKRCPVCMTDLELHKAKASEREQNNGSTQGQSASVD